MSNDFTYSIANDTANSIVESSMLHKEIEASSIAPNLICVNTKADALKVYFESELTGSEPDDLTALINAHAGDTLAPYRALIHNAMRFFDDLMVSFAAENITLGITQAGKTKAVADYLQNILHYGQTGSLYEVINEIEALKIAGLPTELEPFVTTSRLNSFKASVEDYLP